MQLDLIEYAYNGNGQYINSGTLTFNPGPSQVTKEIKIEWMTMFVGFVIWPRVLYRVWRTINVEIQGGCNLAMRAEIEFYSYRQSVFAVDGSWSPYFDFPEPYSSGLNSNPSAYPWTGFPYALQGTVANPPGSGTKPVTLIFLDTTFTWSEGQRDWYTYDIKLQVCDNGGIKYP
jgi:hypothetical protein